MSRSNWLPYLTAIVIVAAWPVHAQPVGNDSADQSSAVKIEAKSEIDQTPLVLEAIKKEIERLARAIESQDDKANANRREQREESDLNAQWEMARWTKNAVYVALAAILLTLVGIILLWRTLKHTALAANAAVDTVKQATETAAVTRLMLKESENATAALISDRRPWLDLHDLKLIEDFNWAGDRASAKVEVAVKNLGKSPAVDVTFYAKLYPIVTGQAVDKEYNSFVDDLFNQRGLGPVVFPERGEIRQTSVSISKIDIKDSRAAHIYYGVCYRSIDSAQYFSTINNWSVVALSKDQDGLWTSLNGSVLKGFLT